MENFTFCQVNDLLETLSRRNQKEILKIVMVEFWKYKKIRIKKYVFWLYKFRSVRINNCISKKFGLNGF